MTILVYYLTAKSFKIMEKISLLELIIISFLSVIIYTFIKTIFKKNLNFKL